MKKPLKERFQQLAGIKPLYTEQLGPRMSNPRPTGPSDDDIIYRVGDKVSVLMRGTKAEDHQDAIITSIDTEDGVLRKTSKRDTLLSVYSEEEDLEDEVSTYDIRFYGFKDEDADGYENLRLEPEDSEYEDGTEFYDEEDYDFDPEDDYVDEYEQEGWRTTTQYFQFDIDYKRSIENGIDGAHNEFVHPTHGFSGEDDDYKSPSINITNTKWGTGFFNEMYAPPLKEKTMRKASGRDKNAVIEAGTGHHGISMLWTQIHPTPDIFIHQYMYETPIDESHTNLFLVNTRNFLIEPEHDETVMERNQVVAFQDRDVLINLHPQLTPETIKNEFFVAMDQPIKRYRELLDEWQQKGWRINSDEVSRTRMSHAYAIPSPNRRKTKGWVLDPIPTIKS